MVRQTSLLAFRDLCDRGVVSERQREVYSALVKLGCATDWELTKFLCRDDPNYVRPRRNELLNMGLITGRRKRQCIVTGRTAIEWEVQNL